MDYHIFVTLALTFVLADGNTLSATERSAVAGTEGGALAVAAKFLEWTYGGCCRTDTCVQHACHPANHIASTQPKAIETAAAPTPPQTGALGGGENSLQFQQLLRVKQQMVGLKAESSMFSNQ